MTLAIARGVDQLRRTVAEWRNNGDMLIGVVPTMGALHDGHLSLIRTAVKTTNRVIVTIFVNPKQFDDASDLVAYPRTQEEDEAKLVKEGVHLLYAPDAKEMYPPGFETNVSVAKIGQSLCGAGRPGHFDGVATVVSKLLLQSGADLAFFGEKDFQQLLVVRRIAHDLNIPTKIIACPTFREADGLALSSRNTRLSASQRKIAAKLAEVLFAGAKEISAGADIAGTLGGAQSHLQKAGFDRIEYLELCSEENLLPMTTLDKPARLLAAVWLGQTRLIDNVAVKSGG